jgi:hypothetical protein
VTDSPRTKPIGDPPLTPEQVEVWRGMMFQIVGCTGTKVTNIRRISSDGGWLVDNRWKVSSTLADHCMQRARKAKP